MLRSLWSGMSGLNVHQMALDVEANNIANVNTTGFKYSRVSFQDLLSQTGKVSSAGGENIGGTNAIQVGLGVKLGSVEKIFKQGSLQQTDSITDLALQGDGFFVVSGDGGETLQYTRAGGFHVDVNGDMVDANGNKVMGWPVDGDFNINTNNRVENINIQPGMTLPAHGTENVEVMANLSASNEIIQSTPPSDTLDLDIDVENLYNAKGENFNFAEGDSVIITTKDPSNPAATITQTLFYPSSFSTMRDLQKTINAMIKDPAGEQVNRVQFDGAGRLVDTQHWIQSISSPENALFTEVFVGFPTSESSETVKSSPNQLVMSDNMQELFDGDGKKIDLQNGQGIFLTMDGLNDTRKLIYREVDGGDGCLVRASDYQDKANISLAEETTGMHWSMDANGDPMNFNVGDSIDITFSDVNGDPKLVTFEYGTHFSTIDELVCAMNEFSPDVNNAKMDFLNGRIVQTDTLVFAGANAGNRWIQNMTFNTGHPVERPFPVLPGNENGFSRMADTLDNLIGGGAQSEEIYQNNIYYFSTMSDMENLLQMATDQAGDPLNTKSIDFITPSQSGEVSINELGQIEILNSGSKTFGINITGYPDVQTENKSFTNIMQGLNGLNVPDNVSNSRIMKAAYHVVSTEVYDNFGSKYSFDMHFKKMDSSNAEGKITWGWYVEVGEPATITSTPQGVIEFNGDGSLSSYTPATLTFAPNSGLNNQPITMSLDFGELGEFNGIYSQNAFSETMKINQDGYTKGRLENISINGEGTISGMFSNGKSKALSQIAVARFKNNEGLESIGANLYRASANSGEPWIVTAGSPGVASIQNNAVERSNVELSRSLIEMIVYQRGFQANSKTISTADEILKALLDLKR